MNRSPGLSVRLKLALSYAGFVMLAGILLLTAVWAFLLRGRPAVLPVPTLYDLWLVFTPGSFGPRIFVPAAIMVMAFLLLFGIIGGWALAGRMLGPLSRITEAARKVTKGSLSHRIDLEGAQDEFRELADSFDAMLARLEAHVAEQRRFAANASHELRTPLAISQTLLEVARNDPDNEPGKLVERLYAVNARAIALTEALLLLSRAEQGAFDRDRVDLSLLAEEAAETLLPLAEERGVTIKTANDVAPAIGSHVLLLQMATNLMHNAILHNLPEKGVVWVETGLRAGTAMLSVENSGAQLAPDSISTLIEPFQRGSGRIRSDDAGVGLGLAIVRSIIEAHDGNLRLLPRAAGGLHVKVELPAIGRI